MPWCSGCSVFGGGDRRGGEENAVLGLSEHVDASGIVAGRALGITGVLSADFSALRYLSLDRVPGEHADRSTAVAPDGTYAAFFMLLE